MDAKELYEAARKAIRPIALKGEGCAGQVACALETQGGAVITGICIDLPCSLGFCAEQAAVAEMLKSGETQIRRIVAVYEDGSILPPCGRCREFIAQVSGKNLETTVILPGQREEKLKDLLPERWDGESSRNSAAR